MKTCRNLSYGRNKKSAPPPQQSTDWCLSFNAQPQRLARRACAALGFLLSFAGRCGGAGCAREADHQGGEGGRAGGAHAGARQPVGGADAPGAGRACSFLLGTEQEPSV